MLETSLNFASLIIIIIAIIFFVMVITTHIQTAESELDGKVKDAVTLYQNQPNLIKNNIDYMGNAVQENYDILNNQIKKVSPAKGSYTVPYTYVGCYKDGGTPRTLPTIAPNPRDFPSCFYEAKRNGAKYFGMQWAEGYGGKNASCTYGNELPTLGLATTCSADPNTNYVLKTADPRVPVPVTGYSMTNAVYQIM